MYRTVPSPNGGEGGLSEDGVRRMRVKRARDLGFRVLVEVLGFRDWGVGLRVWG